MKTVFRLMLGVSALAVAGCSDLPGASLGATFSAEPYLQADHGGPGFTGALASEYTELGRNQAGMDLWMNATAFIAKARTAEAGSEPAPWTPDELGVNGEASQLYGEVVDIISRSKNDRPEACARAQAMWDQYLWALYAEGNGADCPLTAADALALLNEAVAACAGAPAATEFIVYFGFNRTDLTARAQETIEAALVSIQDTSPSAISIVGHTDTVGSLDYNQGLSERRAQRVAEALAARGVPTSIMALAGRSWTEPAVVTGPNVREPLNRRVEIGLSQ